MWLIRLGTGLGERRFGSCGTILTIPCHLPLAATVPRQYTAVNGTRLTPRAPWASASYCTQIFADAPFFGAYRELGGAIGGRRHPGH